MSGQHKVDGRRERTKRTRSAIVEALTELIDEGRVDVTGAEIAARAVVALRSIGQHFASREELLLAVAEHHANRYRTEPVSDGGPFEDRLEAFVTTHTRVLEASCAMRRAGAFTAARSPAAAQALARAAAARRADAARVFAREIAASAEPRVTERSLALVTSGRIWDTLRGELGLGLQAARAQVVALLRAIVR